MLLLLLRGLVTTGPIWLLLNKYPLGRASFPMGDPLFDRGAIEGGFKVRLLLRLLRRI